MKKRLSPIVKEYKFDSVQAFYKEVNAVKSDYLDYKAARVECIRQGRKIKGRGRKIENEK